MTDVLSRLTASLESRYRVSREIGAGGMATVYLAHDLRHERDVAIKVLHPDLAAALGAERFLAEIKTTAKLQHPHILPLLDSGEADGLLYYVMPYVTGESLRARIERETQLPVDDAVRIAREVLSALESAHKQGVVHRDIKPENILLHEDQALVADFGISLAVSAAGGPRMTQTGLSLGTPAYMAPEQAMSERVIDGRADIYALGAVLYEMLVGEAPFTGPTVQAIVARVMTENPRPVTGQRKSVPAHVNAAVLKSLEKVPADRFHSAGGFSNALANREYTNHSVEITKGPRTTARERVLSSSIIPWVVAGMALIAALVFAARGHAGRESSKPAYVSVDLPPGMDIPPNTLEALAISDDGQMIAIGGVFGGRSQIVLRRIDRDEVKPVPGSIGAKGGSAFSRDGKWLAFGTVGGIIYKAPVNGGKPTPIATAGWAHIDWIGSDAIVYTKDYNTGLYRVSSEGRDTATLTTPDRKKGELGHWWPQVLPDGDHVLFTNYTTPPDRSKVEVLSLKTGKRQVVVEGGYFGRYVAGHLLFVRNSALMDVDFDVRKFRVNGAPFPVSIDIETNPTNGYSRFAVAANGTLVYEPDILNNVALSWSDADGNEEPAIDSAGRYTDFAVSPEGKRIAVVSDGDVWIYDTYRKLSARLTHSEQIEKYLAWTPDGRDVLYVRDIPQFDIFKRAADGSTPENLLLTSGNDKTQPTVSLDGRTILYQSDPAGNSDIFEASADASGRMKAKVIIDGPGFQGSPVFSRDGRWITYLSDESGVSQLYLSPWPLDRGPARQQVSDAVAEGSSWAPDGHTIFYSWANRILRVHFDPSTGLTGKPEILNKIQPVLNWTVAPDGRFLVARIAKGMERHSVRLVLNWASSLADSAR